MGTLKYFFKRLFPQQIPLWSGFLLAVLFLSSCGGGEPQTQATLTPKPVPPKTFLALSSSDIQAIQEKDGEAVWQQTGPEKTSLITGERNADPLTTSAGRIFWATPEKILAFTLKDGKKLWEANNSDTSSSIAADETQVYVVTRSIVYAFDAADGTLKWRTDFSNEAYTGNVGMMLKLFGKTLYATHGNLIFALDPQTGKVHWRHAGILDAQKDEGYFIQTVLFDKDKVIVIKKGQNLGDGYGYIEALQASNGQVAWSIADTKASDAAGYNEGYPHYYVYQSYLENGVLYLFYSPSVQRNDFAAFDAQTGKQSWAVEDLKIETGAAVINQQGLLSVGGPSSGDLYRYALADGKEVWNTLGSGTYKTLVMGKDLLFAQTESGGVDAFDIKTGKRKWSYKESDITLLMTLDDDTYVVKRPSFSDITLIALDSQTGKVRWEISSDRAPQVILDIP